MYAKIRGDNKEVVVTVSNLTVNQVEYKSIQECTYDDFCDWIWGSCNYIPFMSLLEKNSYQYADGGFGSLVPIREAILRGATEIDAIILETEVTQFNKLLFMMSNGLFSIKRVIGIAFFSGIRIKGIDIPIG